MTAYLATISKTSRTPVSALYRRVLKSIPRVIVTYDLDMTEKQVKDSVRELFRKNSTVTDPRLVDRLLHKGELDLQETVEQWKQKNHLHNLLGHDSASYSARRL